MDSSISKNFFTIERLTKEVKSFAINEGADLVGIANVERWEHAPKKLRPQAHLPEARSVISMAVHHPDACVEWGGEPNPNYPGPFQIGMIPKLDTISFRIARFLQMQGFISIPFSCTSYWRHRPYKDIPYAHAASFSHMNAFVAAGLGEYGWHGMVMSPKYGPRQRIVSVITAAELESDPLYAGDNLCDRCGLCEKHCPGKNYEKHKLLDPEYIEFKIEGKLFKYPNINRWRCFYGEQVHLDMNELAKLKDMTEEKIYEAIKKGVKRITGTGGYLCSSFKFCMAKPVRKWDRTYSPGPRRKKDKKLVALPTILKKIEELAINNGADRIAIQPLHHFNNLKDNFSRGFRTNAFFDNFSWVITLGRSIGNWKNLGSLVERNKPALEIGTDSRLKMGIMDISRYLDDLGIDATQDWPLTGITSKATERVGWDNEIICQSVICQMNFEEMQKTLKTQKQSAQAKFKINKLLPFLKHVDKIGVVSIDKIQHPDLSEIKKINPDMRSLIVLLSGMPQRVVELAGKQEAECGMSYAFVNYQIIRETLWAAHDTADWLKAQGYQAIPLIDLTKNSYQTLGNYVGKYFPDLRANAPFAAAAGMGEIGLSGLLLTPEFGPRQRYSFVLTNAELAESSQYKGPKLCQEDCTLCADACPVQALDRNKKTKLSINEKYEYPVFERQESRCRWARNLGMVAGEGSSLCGWQIPDLPVPDSLSDEDVQKALAMKDPIQSICYKNPNHEDIIIERCLQACPVGKI